MPLEIFKNFYSNCGITRNYRLSGSNCAAFPTMVTVFVKESIDLPALVLLEAENYLEDCLTLLSFMTFFCSCQKLPWQLLNKELKSQGFLILLHL